AVFTTIVDKQTLYTFCKNIQRTPVLLQELIAKEYEIRATVVGTRIFAIRINSQAADSTKLDWRRDQIRSDMYSVLQLPDIEQQRIIKLHTRMGLFYGAYDFIVDREGQLVFLEVNPSGQWLWLEHATGAPISLELATALAKRGDYHCQ